MTLLVGNLVHIAVNAALSAMGALAVAYRLRAWKLSKIVFWGLVVATASCAAAAIPQVPSAALLYFAKLVMLLFAFFAAVHFPFASASILASAAGTLFLVDFESAGYGKLNSLPIVELALFVTVMAWHSGVLLSAGVYRCIGIATAALILLQAAALGSRGFALIGVLALLLVLMPLGLLRFCVRRLWLLRVAYVGVMVILGLLFLTSSLDLLPPTKSNLDRTVMLAVLAEFVPSKPYGVDHQEYSEAVAAAMAGFDRQPYSEGNLDPHSFLGYVYLYNGWLGAVAFLLLLRAAVWRISQLARNLPAAVIPLLGAIIVACTNPPSTWPRLEVVCVLGVLIALSRGTGVEHSRSTVGQRGNSKSGNHGSSPSSMDGESVHRYC